MICFDMGHVDSERQVEMVQQPHYATETTAIRRIASDPECRWIWKPHALSALYGEPFSAVDVQWGLRHCRVIYHENKQDVLYRAVCNDIDRNEFKVILAYFEDIPAIKIVTVF